MKWTHPALVVVLSVVLATAAAYAVKRSGSPADNGQSIKKETRLEQVKRTGVLRCGYVIWPPFNTKDPNTGQLGGAFYDIVEEIGRQLKLKIEWSAEVTTGQMLSDLNLNRFDMICSPFGESPGRAREADFAGPLVYSPLYLYVRKDDKRFDYNIERANKPDVTLATLDGEFSSIAANENFPEAAKTSIPQLSTSADLYMAVASKKADAVAQDPFSFAEFDAANPGVLRPAFGPAMRVVSVGFPVPADEFAFKATLNTTIAYLHDSGFIDATLQKHEGTAKMLRVAKPYTETAK